MITHDLGVVAGLCDRVMVMYAGRVAETGSVRDIFYRPQHPYSLGLLQSMPRIDEHGVSELATKEQGRTLQKQRILGALADRQLALYDESTFEATLTQEMVRAIYTYLARTPSWLLAVQLEDVLDVLDQANLPGTVNEHPNWRRRLPMGVAELGASPGFALLAEALRREGR
jgi:ABC-type glutathione transport system ATPase component